MNNNEISNPKTEVGKGITLNEKDYMNCLLSTLKEMSKNYAVSLTEVSNENLYQQYLQTFIKISKLQRETYELMFKNGWYKLEKSDDSKVTQKCSMLKQEFTDLNF